MNDLTARAFVSQQVGRCALCCTLLTFNSLPVRDFGSKAEMRYSSASTTTAQALVGVNQHHECGNRLRTDTDEAPGGSSPHYHIDQESSLIPCPLLTNLRLPPPSTIPQLLLARRR